MPQISQQEQEEFEFRARREREQGKLPVKPTAAGEIKAKHAKNVAAGAAAYKPSWTESYETGYKQGGASGMGAALGVANVVGEGLKGAGDAITGIPETIKGAYEGAKGLVDPANWKSAIDNPIVDLPANLVKGVTEPLISPRTTGKALTEAAAPVAVGKAVGAGIRAAGPAAAAGARRITNSIVKPSLKDQAFTKDPTGAILKHRIMGNSTEGYTKNVIGKIDELNANVEKNVAKSGGQVSPAEVNGLLDNTIRRVVDDVGETNSAGIISKLTGIQEKIRNRYGDRNLSVQEVHALRREIDNGINFTEDAVEKSVNKGKYEFRTGLNDIIERHVPGVKATNMDISSLLSAKEALTKRLNAAQNAPILPGPLGMGVEAAAAGGALATGHGLPYAAARLGLKAAGTTAVKSRAAQALESMSGMREPITPIKLPPIEGEVVRPGGYPDQVGLPPATSIQMPSEMNPPRPVSGQLPGRSQRLLPGGSQFDLAQPTYDVVPPTGGNYPPNALSPQRLTNPSNPNQFVEGDIRGGYSFRDIGQQSLLDREILEQQRAASAQGGIELSEQRWQGQLPPEIENMTIRDLPPGIKDSLGMFMRQQGLDAPGKLGTTSSGFVDTMDKFPLARSRPGERGSIRLNAEQNPLSPSQKKRSMLKDPGGSGFNEQRYKFEQDVKVTFADGSVHYDTVKGLNAGHALARARENWEGAKIEPVR